MEEVAAEIKDKIIQEWNKTAKKYENALPEAKKIAWVEFSEKMKKEHNLNSWQLWKIARGKGTKSKEDVEWYKKSINIVTEENFISTLSFFSSLFFYFVYWTAEAEVAKFLSIFSFSLGVGEIIGEKTHEEQRNKKVKLILLLFLIIIYLISSTFKDFIDNTEIIQAISVGAYLGLVIGFETKKLRLKKRN